MKIGTKLATKDGRIIGNAIVVGTGGDLIPGAFVIETDFGNLTTLSMVEIENWFHIGRVTDLARWKEDRARLRTTT